MIALAERNARRTGLADRIAVRVDDVAALPCPDGSFDLIVSILSMHHWPGRDARGRRAGTRPAAGRHCVDL